MTILDRLVVTQGVGLKHGHSGPYTTLDKWVVDENLSDYSLGAPMRHALQLAVRVDFWANSVEYEEMLNTAKNSLLSELYRDRLDLIDNALFLIRQGEKEQVYSILCQMKKEMVGY